MKLSFLLACFILLFHSDIALSMTKDKCTICIEEEALQSLDGEWEFYWKEFLDYEDFYSGKELHPMRVKIPSYWTEYTLYGKQLPGKGFGTYRKTVCVKNISTENLSLNIPVFDDSYRLYINGTLISQSGIAGKSREESEPGYNPGMVSFNAPSDSFDIIIQVANFYHRRGGFWESMNIGPEDVVLRNMEGYSYISFISIGILAGFSIFFLSFFLLYRRNLIAMCFSIVLLGILIRLLNTDLYPMLRTNISWDWIIRWEYIGSFLALIGGIWYFNFLYPSKVLRLISGIFTLVIAGIIVFILSTPVRVFAYTMYFFQPVSVVLLIYYLFVSLRQAVLGSKHSLAIFMGLLIFIIALVNDILVANSQANFFHNYVIHFAVQLFVMIEGIAILSQWIQAYKRTEELNEEIEYINENLEKLVEDRTVELSKKNKEIIKQHDEIEGKNHELEKNMMFSQKLFSIIAHDLKSPITSIFQLTEFYYDTIEDAVMKKAFRSMRDLSSSSISLIENMLYWGRSQGGNIRVNKEDLNMNILADEVQKFFEVSAGQKKVSLKFETDPDARCLTDRLIALIILRNLLSNAIKFTPVGGEVIFTLNKGRNGDGVVILIDDSGAGLEEEKIRKISLGEFPSSSYGTSNEKGSGLGLPLCFELIRLLDGKLELQNRKEGGLRVRITLGA